MNALKALALDGSAVLALQGKNIGYFALIQTLAALQELATTIEEIKKNIM